MKYKEDWEEAQHRYSALWGGEMFGRPCIDVRAPKQVSKTVCVPEPADDEARWLAPAYILPDLRRELAGTWWGGESIPGRHLMAGWVNCLGGTPVFDSRTIWFEKREVDFSAPSPFRHDPQSPWVRKHRELHGAVLEEAGWDDFMAPGAGGLPANDLLSMMMGTENFLLALMDEPDWMEEAIITGALDQLRQKNELRAVVRSRHMFWYGKTGWMCFWAPEPFLSTQSDVSCMLSPAAFERFVLPEIEIYGRVYNALWYHLDGGDARQHLPCLLALPYLRVLQYTPAPNEPPNGPAHMDFYRRVQGAGKIVHIELPKENVERVVRELDPSLLMLKTRCGSPEEGEGLLKSLPGWANVARRNRH